jgi:hypothetical protein
MDSGASKQGSTRITSYDQRFISSCVLYSTRHRLVVRTSGLDQVRVEIVARNQRLTEGLELHKRSKVSSDLHCATNGLKRVICTSGTEGTLSMMRSLLVKM